MLHSSIRSRKSLFGFGLVQALVVVMLVGIVASVAIPAARDALIAQRGKASTENLRVIESAKHQFALNNPGVELSLDQSEAEAQLAQYLPKGRLPVGIHSGETYVIGTLSTVAESSVNANAAYEPWGNHGPLLHNAYNDLESVQPVTLDTAMSAVELPAGDLVEPPDPTPTAPTNTDYTVTLSAGAGGSVVILNNGATTGTFPENTSITISATPSAGYSFDAWSGTYSTNSGSYTFTLTGDTNLSASFDRLSAQLRIDWYAAGVPATAFSAEGKTSSSDAAAIGYATFDYWYGDSATFSVGNTPGYEFQGWSGAVTGSSPTGGPLVMSGNKTVTATFVALHDLTTNILVDGIVSNSAGTITRAPNQTQFRHGDTVNVTVAGNPGYVFTGWSGDASSSSPDTEVTMNMSKTLNANFSQNTVAIVADGSGVTVPEGGQSGPLPVRLSAQPIGDVVVSVVHSSGDPDITISSGASLTFTTDTWNQPQEVVFGAAEDNGDNIDGTATIGLSASGLASTAITATESDDDNTLTVTSPHGTVSQSPLPNGLDLYDMGTSVVLTATADPGFSFTGWSEDLVSTVNPAPVLMNGTNKRVTANYAANTVGISTSVNSVAVPEGTSGVASVKVRLTAQPASDVIVTAARENGDSDISVSGGASLTFTTANWNTHQTITFAAAEDNSDNIAGAATISFSSPGLVSQSITANEVDDDHSLTVIAHNGLVAKSPETTYYDDGSTVSLQATANQGYSFSNWTGDLDTAVPTGAVLMNADKTVEAHFAAIAINSVSTINVPEGQTATLNVQLSAKPDSDVVVAVVRTSGDSDISVASGATLTFTPANWSTAQSVTLEAGEDDNDKASGAATLTLSAPGLPSKTVTASEVDDDHSLTVLSNHGVVAASPAPNGANLYDNGVIVRLSATPDAGYQFAAWSGNLNSGYNPSDITMNGDKTVTATYSPNNVGIETSVTNLVVPEGSTNAFNVRLTAQPMGIVLVTTARAAGDSDISVSGNATMLFTTDNWNVFQPVTLAAAQDDADKSNGSSAFSVSADGLTSQTVSAFEQDNDIGLTVNASGGSVSKNPVGTPNMGNPAETLFNVGTIVSLSAIPDVGHYFSGWTGDIVATSTPGNVSMTGADKSVTAHFPLNNVQIQASTPSISVPEGSTAVPFSVQLSAQPTGDVVVSVSRTSGDTDISVSTGNTLTFTTANWNTPQNVVLAAAEDYLDNANGTATITLSSPGLTSQTVTASEVDDDYSLDVLSVGGTVTRSIALPFYDSGTIVTLTAAPDAGNSFAGWSIDLVSAINPDTVLMNGNKTVRANYSTNTPNLSTSGTSIVVPEGASNTLTVALTAQPSGNVTVNAARTSGDPDISVGSGASMIFTTENWAVPQTVVLAAAQDDDDQVNGATTIGLAATGAITQTAAISVTEQDNDVGLKVVSPSGVVARSPSGTLNANDADEYLYNSGTNVSLTATPNVGYTFLNWTGAVSTASNPATVSMVGPDKTITANYLLNTVDIVPNVSGISVAEGGAAAFSVRLSAQPTSDVTVNVARTSGDPDLVVTEATALSFTTANWNTPQSVTVSAVEDDFDNVNGSATFSLTSPGLTTQTVTATEVDDDYILTVNSDHGTVVQNPGANGSALYDSGTTTTLTAEPDNWWAFSGWTGDLVSSSNPSSISMAGGNKTVTANYVSSPNGIRVTVIVNKKSDNTVIPVETQFKVNVGVGAGTTLTFPYNGGPAQSVFNIQPGTYPVAVVEAPNSTYEPPEAVEVTVSKNAVADVTVTFTYDTPLEAYPTLTIEKRRFGKPPRPPLTVFNSYDSWASGLLTANPVTGAIVAMTDEAFIPPPPLMGPLPLPAPPSVPDFIKVLPPLDSQNALSAYIVTPGTVLDIGLAAFSLGDSLSTGYAPGKLEQVDDGSGRQIVILDRTKAVEAEIAGDSGSVVQSADKGRVTVDKTKKVYANWSADPDATHLNLAMGLATSASIKPVYPQATSANAAFNLVITVAPVSGGAGFTCFNLSYLFPPGIERTTTAISATGGGTAPAETISQDTSEVRVSGYVVAGAAPTVITIPLRGTITGDMTHVVNLSYGDGSSTITTASAINSWRTALGGIFYPPATLFDMSCFVATRHYALPTVSVTVNGVPIHDAAPTENYFYYDVIVTNPNDFEVPSNVMSATMPSGFALIATNPNPWPANGQQPTPGPTWTGGGAVSASASSIVWTTGLSPQGQASLHFLVDASGWTSRSGNKLVTTALSSTIPGVFGVGAGPTLSASDVATVTHTATPLYGLSKAFDRSTDGIKGTVSVGDIVTFSITADVKSARTLPKIIDVLPEGFTVLDASYLTGSDSWHTTEVGATGSSGAPAGSVVISGNTVTATSTLGTLDVGPKVTLYIRAMASRVGTWTNFATLEGVLGSNPVTVYVKSPEPVLACSVYPSTIKLGESAVVYRSVTNPTPVPMNVVCRDISTWEEYWSGTLAPYETHSFDLVTAPASTGTKSYRFEAASTDTPSAFEVVRSPIATLNVAASNSSITITKEVSLNASGPWGPSVAINTNGTKVYFRITANFNANSNSPVYKGSQYRIWDYLPAELTYDTSSFSVVSNTGCVVATTASTRILQPHDVECTVGTFTVTPTNYAANTGIAQTAVIRFSATFSTSASSAYVVNYARVDSAIVPGQAAVVFNGATPYPDGALVTWTDEPGGGNFSGSIQEVPAGTSVPLFASANVGYRFKGFFLTDQVNVRNVGTPQLVNGAYGYKTLTPFSEAGEIGTLLLDVDKIVLVDFDKIRYAFYWNKTTAPGQADAIVDVSSPGSASTYDAVNISVVASALAGADTAELEAALAEGGATSSQKTTSSRATTTTYFGYGTKPSAIANLGLGGADHEGNWVLYTQTATTTTTSWSSANEILVIDVDTHELVGTLDSTFAADIESALPNADSANSNQFTVNGQTGFAAGYFFTTRVATSSTSTSSSSAWSPVIIDFGDKPDLLAGPDAWKKGRVLPPLIDAMRLFNLDATYPKFWEWVGPKSGILVWNPTGDELLQPTGADLFGNVTWFGNWNDGYEPLALLDANKDGQLLGGELDGLSIWLDANTDAIVQPGEMRKAVESIVSISVLPRRSGDGNAEVQDGVTTRDNKTHNTRDWWSAGGIDRNAMSRYRADLEAPCIYDWLPTEFNKSEQGGYLRFWLSEKGNLCVASAPRQDVVHGKILLKVFTGSLDGKYITWWSDALKTTATISEDGSHLSGVTVDLMTGKQSEWTANRKSGGLLSALMVAR